MNGTREWKRSEEREVDIIDLMKYLLRHWLPMLLAGVIFAVLAGGASYLLSGGAKKTGETPKQDAAQKIELKEDEKLAVQYAQSLYRDVADSQEYLQKSILMNVDPYHVNQVSILFGIESADKKLTKQVMASYLAYVNRGGLVNGLKEKNPDFYTMDATYLQELLTAQESNETESNSTVNVDIDKDSYCFYIDVIGATIEQADTMANDVVALMTQFASDTKLQVGDHGLQKLLMEEQTFVDHDLADRVRAKYQNLNNSQSMLTGSLDSFSEEQTAIYEAYVEGVQLMKQEAPVKKVKKAVDLKMVVIGFVGGVFVICCIFGLIYLMNGTIKTMDELEEMYILPVLGSMNQVESLCQRVKILCQQADIHTLILATDYTMSEKELTVCQKMVDSLSKEGMKAKLCQNIMTDASKWDEVIQTQNVLHISKLYQTKANQLEHVLQFYAEHQMNVIGLSAFDR